MDVVNGVRRVESRARRRTVALTSTTPGALLLCQPMATPLLVGIGAIAAGLAGRHILRRRAMGAADQWVKGGFKSKMDRKEALAILGLKCIYLFSSSSFYS
jgi:hypothetical protein